MLNALYSALYLVIIVLLAVLLMQMVARADVSTYEPTTTLQTYHPQPAPPR